MSRRPHKPDSAAAAAIFVALLFAALIIGGAFAGVTFLFGEILVQLWNPFL